MSSSLNAENYFLGLDHSHEMGQLEILGLDEHSMPQNSAANTTNSYEGDADAVQTYALHPWASTTTSVSTSTSPYPISSSSDSSYSVPSSRKDYEVFETEHGRTLDPDESECTYCRAKGHTIGFCVEKFVDEPINFEDASLDFLHEDGFRLGNEFNFGFDYQAPYVTQQSDALYPQQLVWTDHANSTHISSDIHGSNSSEKSHSTSTLPEQPYLLHGTTQHNLPQSFPEFVGAYQPIDHQPLPKLRSVARLVTAPDSISRVYTHSQGSSQTTKSPSTNSDRAAGQMGSRKAGLVDRTERKRRTYKKRGPSAKAGKPRASRYTKAEETIITQMMASGATDAEVAERLGPHRSAEGVEAKWWRMRGGNPKAAEQARKSAQAAAAL